MTQRKYTVTFIVMILAQLVGHGLGGAEIVGWDYCIEEGHPFVAYTHKFGFPFPTIERSLVYGCLTIPHIEVSIAYNSVFTNAFFWIVVFWIVSKYDGGELNR